LVSMTSLGTLRRLIIGHDGIGHGAGWYLEKVIVSEQRGAECVPGKELVFPCNRWLDDHEDDGRTERELLAAGNCLNHVWLSCFMWPGDVVAI